MAEPGERPIGADELERAVRAADPTAWIVPQRILRRVIKRDRGWTFFGQQVPHRHCYTVAGESLRTVVAGAELGLPDDAPWPSTVILIARPEDQDFLVQPNDVILTDCWRLLFHARVHVALEAKRADGTITADDLRQRIDAIGRAGFDEVRTVLRLEGALLPPADDGAVYVEFAATFLELRLFAPALLPHTFPGIEHPAAVAAFLAEDVDDEAIFFATRIVGAAEPGASAGVEAEEEMASPEVEEPPAAPDWPATGASRRLLRRAAAAGGRGNLVRAGILRTQAARRALPDLAESVRSGARAELDRLIARLQAALGFDDAEADRWRRAVPALIDRASRGFWTPEARLLYDLQKVCVDHEREVFTIDLVSWVASWGRRPIRRAQPHLREVMIANHLRSAARRLPSIRLASEERARLAVLLRTAVNRAEAELRDRLRGPIHATLEATDIAPKNLPEWVAYHKLIEELLDKIAGRGFLTLGDLRDACSRSSLKLPDLAGVRDFFRGDRLLQADRALAQSLDGVYRPGEIYLRQLQRLSALAFATAWGRFLTLYVALPFGGAYIVLEGLEHLINPVVRRLGGVHVHIQNPASLLLLGTVALGAINFLGFRRRFLWAMRTLGLGLRLLMFDGPSWVLRQPLFRLLFAGRLATLVWRYLIKPALIAAPFWGLASLAGVGARGARIIGAVAFAEAIVVVNSRIGRNLEEIVADETVRAWRQLYRDVVPGLFRWVMSSFHTIVETIDRLLYAVDEWLRFRSGQTGLSLVGKVVLGTVWFFVAYLVRIYVNLLIEPQVNPIKHFPVVTVSHKVILPFSITLVKILAAPLTPILGKVVGNFIAGTTVLLFPGVFGFLVWELKENWRLYEANRPETLGRVIVGEHGETVGRLLRPGFHSGTLPKLFAKLRRSERRRLRDGREKAVLRHRESLHHVELSLHRYIDREFLALVRASRTVGPLEIEADGLEVSTNRIRMEFRARDFGEVLRIDIEELSGCLIAIVTDPGWLPSLNDERKQTLLTAILGLYKKSGIEWVREPETDPDPDSALRNGHTAASRLVSLHHVAVTWREWVEAWERDQTGPAQPPRFLAGLRLLPEPLGSEASHPSSHR